tara:strand:- start:603 stop:1082 length:480 start_codon:yes stop_codon:yes gene_type:complete
VKIKKHTESVKVNSKIITAFLGWVVIILAGLFGYWIGSASQQILETELQQIINRNTQSIQSLAVVAKTESNNAEILAQILNSLNGDPVKDLTGSRDGFFLYNSPDFLLEDGDKDIPLTFGQIAKDQREIDLGIRSISSGNIFQANTLHSILKKIESKNE